MPTPTNLGAQASNAPVKGALVDHWTNATGIFGGGTLSDASTRWLSYTSFGTEMIAYVPPVSGLLEVSWSLVAQIGGGAGFNLSQQIYAFLGMTTGAASTLAPQDPWDVMRVVGKWDNTGTPPMFLNVLKSATPLTVVGGTTYRMDIGGLLDYAGTGTAEIHGSTGDAKQGLLSGKLWATV